jgi:hypothetical protein
MDGRGRLMTRRTSVVKTDLEGRDLHIRVEDGQLYLKIVDREEKFDIEVSLPAKSVEILKDFLPDAPKPQPLRKEDGSQRVHVCNCNVFHHPDDTDLELYKCNSCGATYRDGGSSEWV